MQPGSRQPALSPVAGDRRKRGDRDESVPSAYCNYPVRCARVELRTHLLMHCATTGGHLLAPLFAYLSRRQVELPATSFPRHPQRRFAHVSGITTLAVATTLARRPIRRACKQSVFFQGLAWRAPRVPARVAVRVLPVAGNGRYWSSAPSITWPAPTPRTRCIPSLPRKGPGSWEGARLFSRAAGLPVSGTVSLLLAWLRRAGVWPSGAHRTARLDTASAAAFFAW